jgi:hypothetical protein
MLVAESPSSCQTLILTSLVIQCFLKTSEIFCPGILLNRFRTLKKVQLCSLLWQPLCAECQRNLSICKLAVLWYQKKKKGREIAFQTVIKNHKNSEHFFGNGAFFIILNVEEWERMVYEVEVWERVGCELEEWERLGCDVWVRCRGGGGWGLR